MINKNTIKGKCCKCGKKVSAYLNLQKYCSRCLMFLRMDLKTKREIDKTKEKEK